jgi:outer membrane protein assembly factor BamB
MRTIGMTVAVYLCLISVAVSAADWEQWRGPTRNGVSTDPTALLDAFPAEGLKPLWVSEKIKADKDGGFGSVAVVGGKVYVYANPRHPVPLTTRTLAASALIRLGWTKDMPDELLGKVEEARLSPERTALKRNQVRNWVRGWVGKNVPREDWKLRQVCEARLNRGEGAISVEICRKLEAIADKEFADVAAFDKWLDDNALAGGVRNAVVRAVPTTTDTALDKVFCLDAETGKRAWLQELPGVPSTWQSSSTPCVVDGRVYVAGSGGKMYCLNAETGDIVWQGKFGDGRARDFGSSFAVIDGCAMLMGGGLMGLDAATGKERWVNKEISSMVTSVAIWLHEGRKLAVVSSGRDTFCVDPATGKTLWKVPGGGSSTPAIVGDDMAILTSDKKVGLIAYKLNLTAPKKLWNVLGSDRGASPVIHEGHVYSVGNKAQIVCVELATGKTAWLQRERTGEYASPVVADGKLLHVLDKGFCMIEASPNAYKLLGKVAITSVRCTSPAIVQGRLYLRMKDGVACFDLRKPEEEGAE